MYLSLLSFSHIDVAIRTCHRTAMNLFDQVHQSFRVKHSPHVKKGQAIFPCGAKDDSGGGRESSQSPFSIRPNRPLCRVLEGDAEFGQAIPDAV
jgi:hypothetical protein